MGRVSLRGEELEKEKPEMIIPSLEGAGSGRERGRTKKGEAGDGKRFAGDEGSRIRVRRGTETQNVQYTNIRRLKTMSRPPWRNLHELPLNVSAKVATPPPPPPLPPKCVVGS